MIFKKAPAERKDYAVDWSQRLGSDPISTSGWTSDAGITVENGGYEGPKARGWVSGGTKGGKYRVTNTVTSTSGRTESKSFIVHIQEES